VIANPVTNRKLGAVLAGVVLAWPATCRAQDPSSAAAPAITAGWQDGFLLQSPDGDNRLLLGASMQTDGRFSFDHPAAVTDTFILRRARPTIAGRIAKYFDFKVTTDFAGGSATVLDAYFDIRVAPHFRLRTGKDKTPVGYELLMGENYLLFPERAFAASLVPNRDVGVQAQGDLAGGRLSYTAGVFNGITDGSSSTTDVDLNNGKDLAGRIVVQPLGPANSDSRWSGLGVHLGASAGWDTGPLPSFKTSVGQTYFTYASGVTADGAHIRVAPAVFYYHEALGAFAEYVSSDQDVAKSARVMTMRQRAWDVSGSWVLTGEHASDRGVRPIAPFDPGAGHYGALQLVARYMRLTIDPAAFAQGLAAPGASASAAAWTIGASWYPATFIKYSVSFERTTFVPAGGPRRPTEHSLIFRAQVAF
jgi:phosphate-selective porin OprO/OprP